MLETTDAITIRAPAAEVWPWLAQMGYDRAGWYTDASWWDFWVDPLLRAFMTEEERARALMRTAPSADRILPQFQHLEVGDQIYDGLLAVPPARDCDGPVSGNGPIVRCL